MLRGSGVAAGRCAVCRCPGLGRQGLLDAFLQFFEREPSLGTALLEKRDHLAPVANPGVLIALAI